MHAEKILGTINGKQTFKDENRTLVEGAVMHDVCPADANSITSCPAGVNAENP